MCPVMVPYVLTVGQSDVPGSGAGPFRLADPRWSGAGRGGTILQMASRFAMVLVAGWAIVAMPTLCVGGWLEHACAHISSEGHACGPAEPQYAALPSGEEHDHNCGHESACHADPCSQIVKPEDDWSSQVMFVVDPLAAVLYHDAEWAIRSLSEQVDPHGIPPNGHHVKGCPFPDEDIPLLL